MKKADRKYVFILLSIFVCSFIVKEYKDFFLNNIKEIFNSAVFFLIISVITVPIAFLHKIKFGELNLKNLADPTKFYNTISEIISSIKEPSTFICAISIIKGLFLDFFFSETYFSKFNDTEKTFLFIASFYFLISSFIKLKDLFLDVVVTKEALIEANTYDLKEELIDESALVK